MTRRILAVAGGWALAMLLLPVPGPGIGPDARAATATSDGTGESDAETGSDDATQDHAAPASSDLQETVTVTAPRPPLGVETPPRDTLAAPRFANLSLALASVPGISGVRRSQNAYEPVIRGLGWERVQTQVNGLPFQGACPGRMDPPATLLSTESVREASVVKGLSSVTLGPGGTGGRLVVSTDYRRPDPAASVVTPWARVARDGSRDGWTGGAGVQGGRGLLDYAAGATFLDESDYASATGIVVPAGQREAGGFGSLGLRAGDRQRFVLGTVLRKGEDTDYPSLTMDSDWDRDRLYNGSWTLSPGGDSLLSVEAHAGLARIDHQMSNRNRINWTTTQAVSRSTADTWNAGASVTWPVGNDAPLTAGIDLLSVRKDALRDTLMVSSGMTRQDHLWPDASQDDAGLFAEHTFAPAAGWRLRLGARYDRVDSAAAATGDPALGGLTVAGAYQRYYGPDAAETSRRDGLWSANVLASKDLSSRVAIEGGVGLVARAASVTELYYAFAMAPGGYLVGNPTLDPERKREASAGVTVNAGGFRMGASVFYYDFSDYVHMYVLENRDVNGDGLVDIVRGFENVAATFAGGEADATVRVSPRVELPLAIAYVRATNRDTGTPLPEIPPLEGRAAVRVAVSDPVRLEIGARFVARQDRIDPSFAENATPGFSVWDLRGRWEFAPRAWLEIGVENLLDKEYNEHLTREAAMPDGDLKAGDEIPQAGRYVVAAIRVEF
jgi:iron complex outermembrane receptor protein